MASDGSQPVEWAGRAFPYLMHHPKNPNNTESYHKQRVEAQGQEHHRNSSSGNVGTWHGPAPVGQGIAPRHAQDDPEDVFAHAAPVSEPQHIILNGGGRMPLVGLGTYKLNDANVVKLALDIGYRHIDCARIYGNEDLVGKGLEEYLAKNPRQSLWITSKVWNDSHRPEKVVESVHATLRDLGCEYLDLLLIHWPVAWIPGTQDVDASVTIKDTYQAMEALVEQGKVKYLGLSNFDLSEIEDVLSWCRIKPVVNQIELHPMLPQRKLVGVSMRKGTNSVAYSPLGHGSDDLFEHPTIQKIAAETGRSAGQVLLKWNIQRGVAVIPKASSESHLRANFQGLFDWRLSWDQKAAIDSIAENSPKRFVNPAWKEWEEVEAGGASKPSVVLGYA